MSTLGDMRTLPRSAPLVVALVATAGCGTLQSRGEPLTAADEAAPFSLTSHTGETVTLGDLTADGPAVVVFYRGFW